VFGLMQAGPYAAPLLTFETGTKSSLGN